MKVLLVDDSLTMRRIQKTQLLGLGVKEVLEAGNGEEAIKTLEASMPLDMIMMDWNMPVMDGFTALKTIRADQRFAGVKIIMCTSESEKTKVIDALKAGANNYLVKPFTPEALKEKLGL